MNWLVIVIIIILIVLYYQSSSGNYEGFCNTGDKCLQITKNFCKCLRLMPEFSEPNEISIPQNEYVDFKAEKLDNYYQYFNPIQFDYVNNNKLNVGLYNKTT